MRKSIAKHPADRARRRVPQLALHGWPGQRLETPSEHSDDSLRQLTQSAAPVAHEFARMCHLLLEARIIRSNPQALCRLGQEDRIALSQLRAFEDIFRKDNPDRFAHLRNLQTDHAHPRSAATLH